MRPILVTCVLLLSSAHLDAAPPQNCRAVSHQQLEKLLPVIGDFTRQKPVGDTDNKEEFVSRTTVDYENRNAEVISVELMDTCGNVHMLSQLREFMKTGPPPMAGTTTRSLQIKGFPAYEEWTAESKHTEIHILVADRFTVKVTGEGVALAGARAAAEAIELKQLASLK
jgi:hypothetical protein